MLRFKKMNTDDNTEDLTRLKKGSNNSNSKNKDSCFQIYNRIRQLRNNNKQVFDELNVPIDDDKSKETETAQEIILDSLSLKHVDSQGNFDKNRRSIDQEELNQLRNNYVHGLIRIQDLNGIVCNQDGCHYLNFKFTKDPALPFKPNELLKNIPKFMSTIWNMKSPQIIIPIITGVSNFKNWKNQKLEEQFKKGIIKAANKTEMWFVTNGINGGITEMIGDAINQERSSRVTSSIKNSINFESLNYTNTNELDVKPLTLIGIVSASSLKNWSSFDGQSTILTASGNKSFGKVHRFDVNSNHTHFIIYDDLEKVTNEEKQEITYDEFRNKSIMLFTRSLSYYRKKLFKPADAMKSFISEVSEDDAELNKSTENRQIPMVALVIRGDLSCIDSIELKIKKEIPVVILKGSGAVADLIAFCFEEWNENKDQEYEDNYIKQELSKKLLEEFNDELKENDIIRNQYRDKILFIVKNSSKKSQKFLTVVDMKGLAFDFTDLDKYILTALLKSHTQLSGKKGKEQMERNLRLTVDWNCPALALSEIFQRDDYTQIEIKHAIFEHSILRKDREEFVELFLDQGFCIHRFLGRSSVRDLFTKSENKEFFITVILQGVLGHFSEELPENFLPDGLNDVLKELTNIDNMVNILEIYMNQLGFYVTDAMQAEKKALNFLIIFGLIFNRPKLVKILWKRIENPLTVALIINIFHKNILPYVHESYLKTEVEKNQNDFALAAIGVLDKSFQNNDPRSYSVLSYKNPEWNNCTVLELAYNAKNLDFMAHPCCQRVLTKRLFGSIQVREINNGIIEFPSWIKVILSAILIFPMYYWIRFPLESKNLSKRKLKKKNKPCENSEPNQNLEILDDDERDEEQREAEETKAELNKKLLMEIEKNRKNSSQFPIYKNKEQLIKNNLNLDLLKETEKSKYTTPPFYRKIFLVWSSPFTKFWMNFISYICFLVLFTYVTLWPCCGNLVLDSILWMWTALMAIENTRITYKNYLTGSQLPIKIPILEICVMISFLMAFFFVRIYGTWSVEHSFLSFNFIDHGLDPIFVSKVVLSFYLLFFFYRTVFTFLPISQQLGPFLFRIKLMVKHDFMIYLRLLVVVVAAGGITLNALLYPFHPIDGELVKKVFLFRGFMQLFAADKLDLERQNCPSTEKYYHTFKGNYSCVDLTSTNFEYTEATLEKYKVSYKCNYTSLSAWLILIQYFLLIKIFLPILLYAMFASSGAKINAKSEQLWHYQRYEIVMDYEHRLIFPPPFTIIVYIFMLVKWAVIKLKRIFKKCSICCRFFCLKHKFKIRENEINETKLNNDEANALRENLLSHNYWRNIAVTYSNSLSEDSKQSERDKKTETNFTKVREDLGTQKKSLQRLNDRVIQLERSMIQNQSYLEQIKNLITQKASKGGLSDKKKNNYIHILSRESPYVTTNISRFFVYEKLVPWEMNYELYDPPLIVLPLDGIDMIFIDQDIHQKITDVPVTAPSQTLLTITSPPPLPSPTPSHGISPRTETDGTKSNQGTLSRAPSLKNSIYPHPVSSSKQQTENKFVWNSIVTIDNPYQPGKKITIDRKSWITKSDEKMTKEPFIYSLDAIGYPKNPMGRTGVRGRGALPRYGPNHEIMAIVTRWKKHKNKHIYVERRKLLEFIAVKDPITGLINIPGEKILGDESKFSVVCRSFVELVFEDSDVERGTNFALEDMISFFATFSSQTPISELNSSFEKKFPTDLNMTSSFNESTSKKNHVHDIYNELGILATNIYSGYIDDPRNTDNAWVEAEIWNFHYDKDNIFDKKISNPASKWREVSSNVRVNSNAIVADVLKEISEVHNAFYN